VDDYRFEYTQQVNLHGSMRIVRGFLPLMKRTGGGAILFISTIHSLLGMPPNTAYASSKSAINAYSGAVAAEYAPFGIRSNVINPGGIFTGQAESRFANMVDDRAAIIEGALRGEKGQPDYGGGSAYDIANTTLFLCSPMARHVTGAVVNVDGGTVNQAHMFYDRRLPPDHGEQWYTIMRNRFTSVEDLD